jgi:hypothetical protein
MRPICFPVISDNSILIWEGLERWYWMVVVVVKGLGKMLKATGSDCLFSIPETVIKTV